MNQKILKLFNNKKAFSVAEAMIALLIGSVALAAAAPMITKQLKTQNFTDTQFRVIMDRLERLEQNSGQIPEGTVAFFSSNVVAQSATNPCPAGWSMAPASWKGRFFKMAAETSQIGTEQDQSLQEHWHDLPSFSLTGMTGANFSTVGSHVVWLSADGYTKQYLDEIAVLNPTSAFAGDVFRAKDVFIGEGRWMFETLPNNEKKAPSVSDDDETRPKNVSLLVCIKD